MEEEVSAQPELLRTVLPKLKERSSLLRGQHYDSILLVARGSSDNAALYARYLLEVYLGIPVFLAAPSVLTVYGARVNYSNSLAIGISQSGAAPDVSEFISYMREQGHATWGITNHSDSLLAREAEHVIELGVGVERSVAATKTYSASLLALAVVAEQLGGPAVAEHMLPTQEWSDRCRAAGQSSVGVALDSSTVFTLGRGYSFATASECALKLMECALIPAKSYSSADFEHGPKALAGKQSSLICFSQISDSLRSQGARILEPPKADSPDFLLPLWQIFFAQWLALSAARERRLDPDKPQFIQKVTETL